MKVNHAVTLVHTWHVCHAESALPLLALTRLEGYIQASIVSHSYGGSFVPGMHWLELLATLELYGNARVGQLFAPRSTVLLSVHCL